jgi:hypothetical protein
LRGVCAAAAALILMPPLSGAAWSRPDVLVRLPDTVSPAIVTQAAQGEANFKVRDISGPAGKPIPIAIETADPVAADGRQLFIFSGLPQGVTLNPGGDLGEFWAVNASVIGSLSLTAPDGFSGSFTVRITRSGGQPNSGVATMRVTIGANGTSPTAAVSAPAPKSIPKPAPSSAGAQLPNHDMLMGRAKTLFEKGDVAGARIIFEYLATQGSAAAAIAMGETFDPGVLAQLVVKGLESDVAKARQWYEKAEELGSRDARRRLNAMMAR